MCKLDEQTTEIFSPRSKMLKKEQDVQEMQQWLMEREQQLAERERQCEFLMKQLQERAQQVEEDDDDDAEKQFRNYWSKGYWVKSCIFGGLDGLTTIIALILSGTAAGPHLVSDVAMLILGIANLLADGFSMGMGDYLSSLAEGDVMKNPCAHGLAWRNGFVMFFSFVFFGAIPLTSFLPFLHVTYETRLPVVVVLAVIVLFVLGSIKGRLTGQTKPLKAGCTMVMMGGAASVLSYFVSLAMSAAQAEAGLVSH
jgi:VIT1/CCC1 family predicted Fe2+/Mn2+ transporter